MSESAPEAALRAMQPTIDKIRGHVPNPCPPEQIPPYSRVKIDGVWLDFDGYQASTGLMFLSSGSSGTTIRPDEGQLYNWAGIF